MSDTVESVNRRFYHPNPVVAWSAVPDYPHGAIEEGSVEIDATITGRFDLWQVPVSDVSPEGLWCNMFNGQYYAGVEPGWESWKQHCLCKIEFHGAEKQVTVGTNAGTSGTNGIYKVDANFKDALDLSNANPAAVELPNLDDKTISGATGNYIDLAVVFTGETCSGTFTMNITPTDCSVKGLASEPDTVISSGSTKVFTGTLEEINSELVSAQVLVGSSNGSVLFKWDYDQTATVTVTVEG